MAKLIYSALTSLDGYISDEEGNFDWATPLRRYMPSPMILSDRSGRTLRATFLHLRPCAERRSPTRPNPLPSAALCGKTQPNPGRIPSHLRPRAERRSPTPAESPPICGLVREDVARPGRECRPRLRPGDAGSAMLPPPASGAEYHRDDSDV